MPFFHFHAYGDEKRYLSSNSFEKTPKTHGLEPQIWWVSRCFSFSKGEYFQAGSSRFAFGGGILQRLRSVTLSLNLSKPQSGNLGLFFEVKVRATGRDFGVIFGGLLGK